MVKEVEALGTRIDIRRHSFGMDRHGPSPAPPGFPDVQKENIMVSAVRELIDEKYPKEKTEEKFIDPMHLFGMQCTCRPCPVHGLIGIGHNQGFTCQKLAMAQMAARQPQGLGRQMHGLFGSI